MHNHSHEITKENKNKTLSVIIFTVVTMIAEILYGYLTGSMALLADGYHMGTHALALGLTYIAYILIIKFKDSPLFPYGTEKIGILAAYTSAIFLGLTGFWIIMEGIDRFQNPIQIQFNEAILVAFIGLAVNTICIVIMEGKNTKEEHCDYNFMAAYYHILADIVTSILAITALIVGKYMGVVCLDSIVGIIGGALIIKWALELIKSTVKTLIDMKTDDSK